MARTPKKSEQGAVKKSADKAKEKKLEVAQENDNRKINPWIPVAIVGFIIALVAVMAVMSSNSSTTPTSQTTTQGTPQSGGTTSGETTDVSWITLETTPAQVSEKAGIPAKMLQQFLGINEGDMGKPFSELGGEEAVASAQSLVGQFGGGAMGGGTSGDTGGMGGTTSP